MTRDEYLAQLTARAADAEKVGALAPLALTLRTIATELEAVDGWPSSRPAPDTLLTLEETADRLNVSKRWLTDNRNHLPFLKQLVPGGAVRVSAAALTRWLATR